MADTNQNDAKTSKIVARLSKEPVVVTSYTAIFSPPAVARGKAAAKEVKKGGKK
jgi:hypothetical protein